MTISGLRADYYEVQGYVFIGILYLGIEEHDDPPLTEGETFFVDSSRLDGSGMQTFGDGWVGLQDGVVADLIKGRLVLFSGGGEHYHAPMKVVQGKRSALHVWFKCTCDQSKQEQ